MSRKWRFLFAPSFDASKHVDDWEALAAELRSDILMGRDTIYEVRLRFGPSAFQHPAMRALSDEEPGEDPLVTAQRLGYYSEKEGWTPSS